MVFFIFLFSPTSFLLLIGSLHKISWIVGTVAILGLGFMISSITEFVIRSLCGHLSGYDYNLQGLFNNISSNEKRSASELAIWVTLDLENERYKNGSGIPNQIHKRWSMAMANLNAAAATIIGTIIALLLAQYHWLSPPGCNWILLDVGTLLTFSGVFFSNGMRALDSVSAMNRLLASRNKT